MDSQLEKEQTKYWHYLNNEKTWESLEELYDKLRFKDAEVSKIFSGIQEPLYTLKDTGLTSRVLAHWVASKLVVEPKDGWHRFNLTDLTIIAVLKELRLYGISLQQLALTVESLNDYCLMSQGENKQKLSWLELGILSTLALNNDKFYLAVFPSGYCRIASSRDIYGLEHMFPVWRESYIKICLNTLVGTLTNNLSVLNAQVPRQMLVEPEYAKTISEIISPDPNLKSVTIKFQDGHDIVTKNFRFKNTEVAAGVLRKSSHGEIKYQKTEGKISSTEVELKSKVPRKSKKETP